MTTAEYTNLVVQWQPNAGGDKTYRYLLLLCLVIVLIIGLSLSLVEVPERERVTREDIPDRVARFITEQPQPEPPPPEPRPEPKPLPVAEPQPVVERERPEPEQQEPLTEQEQQARETAAQSGLLAMGQQLDGLMDTSDVDAMVDTRGRASTEQAQVAADYSNSDVLAAAERAGANTAASSAVVVVAGDARLSRRELAALTRPEPEAGTEQEREAVADRRAGFAQTGRSEEEVTLVFDQNKGVLYSLYNRARRQTPGLEGRLVLEVTIAPSGEVLEVEIVSTELNNPRLEQRIRTRVLQFQFEKRQAENITIIYPIEFLPS